MALHGFGKAESQVQFLLGAPPDKPIPTPDVTRVPRLSFRAAVAHQVEQQTENLCVAGSSPARGTILCVFSSVGIEHWFTKPGVGSSSLSGRTTQLTTIADCCIINT